MSRFAMLMLLSLVVGSAAVGGSLDEGGCLTSAGFVFCKSKGRCLRPWLESCDDLKIGKVTPEAEKKEELFPSACDELPEGELRDDCEEEEREQKEQWESKQRFEKHMKAEKQMKQAARAQPEEEEEEELVRRLQEDQSLLV
eukprot:gnl/TRDRNA2_/TRDRNA2_47094_c0_seq1.p3 gnl/TRDRNA2_/TRDRNA2_47094_c0~~gnl/TRDRNA2_/TRDRNA2_47094_c0_seq1.p3  ORF type:complete len:142 (+),score=42.46 gnl/TRDRNA2_/TRDRNA2_47094_c0_seq1:59-484(+)